MLSFTPGHVLNSHREALETRHVDSVAPEKTDISLDPDSLVSLIGQVGTQHFVRRGVIVETPNNLVRGVRFKFCDGLVEVDGGQRAESRESLATELADLIAPIDDHFRSWSGLSNTVPTQPMVSLLAGKFSGKRPTDTNRHFDYRGAIPQISYKMYFQGPEEFASIYYPGPYQLPHSITKALRAFAGDPEVNHPKQLYPRTKANQVLLPAGMVCAEPWNAFHSGPTAKGARGIERGILGVTYNLARIPTLTGS